jgi:hypothetical protein
MRGDSLPLKRSIPATHPNKRTFVRTCEQVVGLKLIHVERLSYLKAKVRCRIRAWVQKIDLAQSPYLCGPYASNIVFIRLKSMRDLFLI